MRQLFVPISLFLLLGGCGLPLGVQLASVAADGLSLAASGKTTTDHAISAAAKKDCALFRGINGERICRQDDEVREAEAGADAGTALAN